jgi:hypothetical protein
VQHSWQVPSGQQNSPAAQSACSQHSRHSPAQQCCSAGQPGSPPVQQASGAMQVSPHRRRSVQTFSWQQPSGQLVIWQTHVPSPVQA